MYFERYNIFNGYPKAKTTTTILRDIYAEQFIDGVKFSSHNPIMIVPFVVKNGFTIADENVIEMVLCSTLHD
ncbi:unnamed protein product [Rotaria sp. Silwood2]|nr:unnamed protein product [Rotaria sp. Silwood2]CAF3182180.1 unnamed protein product [Rotaria sp. Silwood2]CAF4253442.1 unnamed protein product [Rotaria sp. Silwood2]CAF4551384.1 unnamed protein product [Rotaria sp. Silwood2]CAF4911940.1 unnamed protein product [Rotaria sp. Silwood2]